MDPGPQRGRVDPERRQARTLLAIGWGGLAVGVLDALDAVVFFRATPLRVFQSIASGLLGGEAYQGGLASALLGVLLHFLIATTAAAVYVGTSRRLPVLLSRAIPCGLAYGVAVFAFMSQVVVPLSLARQAPFSTPWLLNGVIGHALLVGLPIALCARRFGPAPPQSQGGRI
jgi:hypothetical protein